MHETPTDEMTLEKLVEIIKNDIGNGCRPANFLLLPNIGAFRIDFETPEDKKELLLDLRDMIARLHPKKYWMFSCVFVGTSSKVRLRDNRERKEMILISEYREDCSSKHFAQTFEEKDDKIVFGEQIDMSGPYDSLWNFYLANKKIKLLLESLDKDFDGLYADFKKRDIEWTKEQAREKVRNWILEGEFVLRDKQRE
jgi:hypothetical protein